MTAHEVTTPSNDLLHIVRASRAALYDRPSRRHNLTDSGHNPTATGNPSPEHSPPPPLPFGTTAHWALVKGKTYGPAQELTIE